MYADFRTDIAPLVVEIPADAGIQHGTAAVLFAVVYETGELAEYVDIRFAHGFLPTSGQTRHDGVRFVFVTVLVGKGLVFLYVQRAVKRAAPDIVAVVQPQLAVEVDVAGNVLASVEVAVVIVV